MDVTSMTRKDFDALPLHEWDIRNHEMIKCNSIVILPLRTKHDSGFRNMDFVAIRDNEPICRLSGWSDVLYFDGIGGYGYDWLTRYGSVPSMVFPSGWSMDCLPKSGLLRIWPSSRNILIEHPFSSFEIYAIPAEKPVQ